MIKKILNKLYKFIDSIPSQYSINTISANTLSKPEDEDDVHAKIRRRIESILTEPERLRRLSDSQRDGRKR